MKNSIIAKLESLQERYEELEALLSDNSVIFNQERFRALSREYTQLSNLIICFRKWQKIQKDLKEVKTLLDDVEIRDIAQEELKITQEKQKELEKQLQFFLLPQDPSDQYPCFIEIRAGTGGQEAALFARDLFRMYSRYCEARCWQVEIINANEGEQGGYKEIVLCITGDNAYARMKFESGGHRVQRIPETESQGRIHTSTCTVAVMPKIPETELPKISSNDLKIDTFRSSGAGGQHVNTTDSAIRIIHLPTGIMAECQDERSQHKNKAKALTVLIARIHAAEIIKRQAAKANMRRNLLGTGERSDRIRTYNYPKGRVTDHRINLTIHNIDRVIAGELDVLIEPIIQEYHTDQLTTISEED
ncbi:peptide chain release factor 1 [Candidatus Pantoea carbekii]|uniref:Peptide chain release factor 1 n=1 Tax=Candidatus Pantoea carbekii TaxID=1235990 RepID=U3U9L8_9GAMM|nr:peptide chain release factor 1 [Candidatus Pantoea carbekii]AKC32035.1 peptide chain release factor 1 PrfA [Candidatus Pantoea carbekii]BAO00558.1 peptide chain release factor 1 [Candidatus Pantoea carbekii]